jgi:avirulence protein
VWDACRSWRAGVAKDGNHPAQAEFATSRVGDTGNSQTPIGSDCAHLHTRITELAGGSPANVERKQGADGTVYDENAFQRQINLGNEEIGLTLMAAYTAPNGSPITIHDPEQNNLPATGRMVHTRAEHIPALLGRAQELFTELTTQSLAKDDQMMRLGEMHWLLAQAMPDRRGSAAKSEMVVRSLAHALGHDLPPLRDGVSLDIEAFFADPILFQLDYADYFEHEVATGAAATPEPAPRSGAGAPAHEAWFTEMDL